MPLPSRAFTLSFLGRFGISLVVSSLVMAAVVVGVNRGIDDRVAKIKRIKLAVAPAPPGGENFLIIGSDSRDGEDESSYGDVGGQRSDTMMVAHVEPGSQRTFVMSFPRDLMVNVPGTSGKSQINSAYSIGGPQLVIQTLQTNFDIPINHYVEVSFKTFPAVVDAIGKVNIYVPGELRDEGGSYTSGFHSQYGAGCYAFDGATALTYVRSRSMQIADPNGPIVDENGKHWRSLDANSPDLNRIRRQQDFVRALAQVAISRALSDPFTAIELTNNVLGDLIVDKDFSRGDVNALVRAFRTVDVNNQDSVEFTTIPTVPYAPDPNRLAVGPEADAMVARLRTFGDDTPKPPAVAPAQVKVEVRASNGSADAEAVATALREQGFAAPVSGRPTGTEVETTEIHYGTTTASAAKTLLDYVPDAKLVPDPTLDKSDRLALLLGRSFTELTVPSTTTTTTLPATSGRPAATTTTAPPTTTTTLPPAVCPN